MPRYLVTLATVLILAGSALAQKSDFDKLQGTWEITSLVDDGVLVSEEQIKSRFSSDGRFTINGQTIQTTTPGTQKIRTMVFVLDEKASPRTLDLGGAEKTGGKGIYLLSDDTLMLCVSEPESKVRPSEFSARKDSPQMLMTLKRVKANEIRVVPPAPVVENPSPAPQEDELRRALLGTWGHQDDDWVTMFTVNSDGSFSSSKNYKKKFGRLFNDDTRSSGDWKIENGVVICRITASTDRDMINQIFSYRIRSISATELIAVDQFGKLRRDWKTR